ATALADQHQEPPARVMILPVGLEVVGQAVDSLGEQRDLYFGRAGVAVVRLELLDEPLLLLDGQPHPDILPGVPPPIATPPEPEPRSVWTGSLENADRSLRHPHRTTRLEPCKASPNLASAGGPG